MWVLKARCTEDKVGRDTKVISMLHQQILCLLKIRFKNVTLGNVISSTQSTSAEAFFFFCGPLNICFTCPLPPTFGHIFFRIAHP